MKTKSTILIYPVLVIGVLSVFLDGCKKDKDNETQIQVPVVSTNNVTGITSASSVCGGNVTDEGGGTVTQRGVCWSTASNPTISDNKTSDGSGSGSFTSNITGLSPNTTYYVRAYATNSAGTSYGSAISFQTASSIVLGTFTDPRDGNTYQTVTIGSQIWMMENLRYLPQVHNNTEFSLAGDNGQPGYGVYGYNGNNYSTAIALSNFSTYGVLYNWFAVSTGNICPAGWRIPSYDDFVTLVDNVGGESSGGGNLKEAGTTHWSSPNTGATNSSGFTALPAGCRYPDGSFIGINSNTWFWTSEEDDVDNSWYRHLCCQYANISVNSTLKKIGYSVRCIKN